MAARMNLQQEQDTLLSLTSCENTANNKYRKRGRVYINANYSKKDDVRHIVQQFFTI